MIRFRMLGTVDLRDSEGRELRSVLRRPKLLALLAYLGAARPHGFHRRDALLPLLWPELDQAHARNALRQTVHSLRETVGRDVLVARGDHELGLDSDRLWCDVVEFENCLDAGEPQPALSLHRGELLAAFHVSDVPDYERWLDLEREHLRRRALAAALDLAAKEEACGGALRSARWIRRALEISPYDEGTLRRLVRLLDQGGNRADAMQEYDAFARRLRADLELEPAPETASLAEAIRARTEPRGGASHEIEVPSGAAPEDEAGHPGTVGSGAGEKRSDRRRSGAAWPVLRARSRPAAMLVLVLGGLLTAAWLSFGHRPGAPGAEIGRDPLGLVVLPFTNLGPAEDEYFADGITEEITARLTAIDGLRVIGATSASRYKGTGKSVREIGTELGVAFVLQGSLRWQKSGEGPARVRVTPQLVSTVDDAQLWAEVYDESLDEIFRVQSEIAQKVARALDVTLREPQRRALEAVPTTSLDAYDYYLRGTDYERRGSEERMIRAALRMYEKAVELDPRFALAYAQLSRRHSHLYWFHYDRSEARLAKAKWAVDKALQLDSTLPDAHRALGAYYFLGRLDYDRALQEFATAAASRPNDGGLFLARAALRTRQGDFRRAIEDFDKALQLDPGSAVVANNAAQGYDLLRDFERAEALYDRAIAVSPDWAFPYYWKATLYLRWDGRTQRARAVLDEARRVGVAETPLLLFAGVLVDCFDRRYEEAVARLSSGAPEIIQGQFRFVPRALLLAEIHELRQRRDLASVYYDSARILVLRELQEWPDDSRLHSALGIAYAGLGRKQEAIRAGEKAVELLPIGREAYRGYYRAWDLARIYAMVGEHDAAIDQLEHLLSIPGNLTAAWLRTDPTWDPLQGHPRFRKLLDRGK